MVKTASLFRQLLQQVPRSVYRTRRKACK